MPNLDIPLDCRVGKLVFGLFGIGVDVRASLNTPNWRVRKTPFDHCIVRSARLKWRSVFAAVHVVRHCSPVVCLAVVASAVCSLWLLLSTNVLRAHVSSGLEGCVSTASARLCYTIHGNGSKFSGEGLKKEVNVR